MMRPVLPPANRARQDNSGPQLGLGKMFSTIAGRFNLASRSERYKKLPIVINPTVVGGTANQRELFRKVRSSSLRERYEGILALNESIEEYSISSIPEIWYAAKDILSITPDPEIRRGCILLLLSCIRHDDLFSAAIRLTYYEDIVTLCKLDYEHSLIDPDFDLILECLECLTNAGENILNFCLNERYPLQDFLNLSLAICHTQTDEKLLTKLVLYIRECIILHAELFDSRSREILVQQVIAMAYHCSSKNLMIILIDFVGKLVKQSVKRQTFYASLELISYSNSLEKEASWQLILSLVEDPTLRLATLTSLSDISSGAGLQETASMDDRVTIMIGALNLLQRSFLLANAGDALKTITSQLIDNLSKSIDLNNQMVNFHVLSLLQCLMAEKYNILDYQHWFYGDHCIIDIIGTIGRFANSNFELLKALKATLGQITGILMDGTLLYNEDKLISLYSSQLDFLQEDDFKFLLKCFDSRSFDFNSTEEFEKRLPVYLRSSGRASDIQLRSISVISESIFHILDENLCDTSTLTKIIAQFLGNKWTIDESTEGQESLISRFVVRLMTEIENTLFFNTILQSVVDTIMDNIDHNVSISLTRGLCELFVLLCVKFHDESRSKKLFEALILLAEFSVSKKSFTIVLSIAKLMIRIRVKEGSKFYFTNPADIEGLSSIFRRNFTDYEENQVAERGKELSWYYPEQLPYLPSALVDSATSHSCILEHSQIMKWLAIVTDVLENFHDWELYSFVWSHFCPQLSNIELFISNPPQSTQLEGISKLRSIICDQLSSKLPPSLEFPEGLGKADLQIAMIRTLTALIAYHDFFSKIEEDALIQSTVDALSTSWEKTAIPCIHFLNISCYEIPLSVKKFLSLILIKLQTRISSFFASPHILEFLMSLSHLPSLSSNFNLEEYKRVFGISFQFIEFSKLNKSTAKDEVFINKHGEDVRVENVPSTELVNITPALSQYLLGLSYSVISSWFLKMNLDERKELSSFIQRNLVLSSRVSPESPLDDQTVGFLDFITRFSICDDDLTMRRDLRSNPDRVSRWCGSNCAITLSSGGDAGDNGWLIVRKGSDSGILKVDRTWDQFHGKELNFNHVTDTKNMLAKYLLHFEDGIKFELLPDIPAVVRSIDNLDRLPVAQFFKTGIVYIGDGQQTEDSILANQYGSRAYQDFLFQIGDVIKLKGCRDIYVGGLDTENDMDGKHAIFWKDKITQLIFHTTTMMPNVPNDVSFSMKKRHVGNNYVNVYFNESGLPFSFNTLKSQFNFINIVITPVSAKFFKVKLYRRNGIPGIFAACHFKLVSQKRLALFVRNLILVSLQFSDVWNFDGQFTGHWGRRVAHITKLHQFIDDSV